MRARRPRGHLSGIPDVVAEVNGEEVTKEEFVPIYEAQLEQATTQSQTTGEAPDEEALKQATLDDLVDTELLAQEAEARGIEVADEDVDAELTSVAEQNGMQTGEELLEAIAQQGMDEEAARAQVETQVLIEQLVEDESGPFEPTEKELRAIYDDAKKQASRGRTARRSRRSPRCASRSSSRRPSRSARSPGRWWKTCARPRRSPSTSDTGFATSPRVGARGTTVPPGVRPECVRPAPARARRRL